MRQRINNRIVLSKTRKSKKKNFHICSYCNEKVEGHGLMIQASIRRHQYQWYHILCVIKYKEERYLKDFNDIMNQNYTLNRIFDFFPKLANDLKLIHKKNILLFGAEEL